MIKNIRLIKVLVLGLFIVCLFPQQSLALRDNTGVADFVKWAFADVPDMITIAQCESGIRQYSTPGVSVKGAGRYIGIFQIDEILHKNKAASLGFDIYSPEGNVGYARYMYSASGTNPWKGCLKNPTSTPVAQPVSSPTAGPVTVATPAPVTAAISSAPISGSLTVNLNLGVSNSQVTILQKILNKLGFTIAASGAGSPGSETSMFGSLTRESVKKFQCAKMSICSGSESTNGYGRVGPMTRSALNQTAQ